MGLSCSEDAAKLRKEMLSEGAVEPDFEHAAHHVVQSNSLNDVSEATRAAEAESLPPKMSKKSTRAELHRIGTEIQSGTFKPDSKYIKNSNQMNNWHG